MLLANAVNAVLNITLNQGNALKSLVHVLLFSTLLVIGNVLSVVGILGELLKGGLDVLGVSGYFLYSFKS